MTLEAREFIRRFLLHVLPPGFHRIRYYGLFGNRHRAARLAQCRRLLGMPVPPVALIPPAACSPRTNPLGPRCPIVDPDGAGRRRAADITSESYRVAREYMVRLDPRDFTDAKWVAALAKAGELDELAFRARFGRFANAWLEELKGG